MVQYPHPQWRDAVLHEDAYMHIRHRLNHNWQRTALRRLFRMYDMTGIHVAPDLVCAPLPKPRKQMAPGDLLALELQVRSIVNTIESV